MISAFACLPIDVSTLTPQEHYLPHFVRSKVKLACSGKDDPAFSKFLEDALKDSDESKRRVLELEHSADLAVFSVLKGNHDRARYYVSKSLEFFLNVRKPVRCRSASATCVLLLLTIGLVEHGQAAGQQQSFSSPGTSAACRTAGVLGVCI